jgi:ketosteroid isomerase-like protein
VSRDSVEVVRRAWEAYLDRGRDGSIEYFSGDCIVEDFPELPDRATYRGREGWFQRDEQFRRPWAEFHIEPVEFIDAGGDVVVVTASMRGRGEGSDLPMDFAFAFVYDVLDGSIVRDRAFTSHRDALAAAGLV